MSKIIIKYPDDMSPKDATAYILNTVCRVEDHLDNGPFALGFKDGIWVYKDRKRKKSSTRSYVIARE